MGVAVATFNAHEDALVAIGRLNGLDVLGRKLTCGWKDPHLDIITELSFETRVLYIKNISSQTTVPRLKEICEKHGRIFRIKKYATKAFVEFESIQAAKDAHETLNDKRFDGLAWKIFPARKYDAEKERDLPDRNICFSKNFISEADQQVLLKFAYDGTVPEVDERTLAACNKIIESVKTVQKLHLDSMTSRLENMRMYQNTGSSKFGNPLLAMYLMSMPYMKDGPGMMMAPGMPHMGGLPNMGGMPGMGGGMPGQNPGAGGMVNDPGMMNMMTSMLNMGMPGMPGQPTGPGSSMSNHGGRQFKDDEGGDGNGASSMQQMPPNMVHGGINPNDYMVNFMNMIRMNQGLPNNNMRN